MFTIEQHVASCCSGICCSRLLPSLLTSAFPFPGLPVPSLLLLYLTLIWSISHVYVLMSGGLEPLLCLGNSYILLNQYGRSPAGSYLRPCMAVLAHSRTPVGRKKISALNSYHWSSFLCFKNSQYQINRFGRFDSSSVTFFRNVVVWYHTDTFDTWDDHCWPLRLLVGIWLDFSLSVVEEIWFSPPLIFDFDFSAKKMANLLGSPTIPSCYFSVVQWKTWLNSVCMFTVSSGRACYTNSGVSHQG